MDAASGRFTDDLGLVPADGGRLERLVEDMLDSG
jgi:hypothetical protein